jgi:carboxyl-terminal processing protease
MTRLLQTVTAALVAVLLTAASGCAAKRPGLTSDQRQLHLDSFDQVWSTVRDKHWDPELGGLDWRGVRDELRPRVEQAASIAEARRAMQEMLDRLELSHFSIIPTEAYAEIDLEKGEGSRDGVTGIDLRTIDGQAVVTSVDDDSPAERAGVRTGWAIVRIGDEDIVEKLATIGKEFEDDSYKEVIQAAAVLSRLRGGVGDSLAVRFLDGDDQAVDLELTLAESRGRRVRFGHLPPMYVHIDVKKLEGNIGYIAFNMFMDPMKVMPAFNDAMKSFMDADGIVIDIRGNPGGLPEIGMGMAGWLVDQKGLRLGTVTTRDVVLNLVVNPRAKTYDGPVAVLVDGLSGSSSEIFSGGLKDIGRAQIIGTRTAGAALPSIIVRLPNGDGFQYAFANYVSAGGDTLEGNGVVPHIEVRPERETLLQGRDPVVQAAIDWIRGQS